MHPIKAVLAREGKEEDLEQRENYATLHQQLHRDLRENVLTCPPEFLTRRLALFFMHQYNTTLKCPSPPPSSSSPGTPGTPSTSTTINDPASPSAPTLCTCPNPPLALSNPTPADESFLRALTTFNKFENNISLIDNALQSTAKKFAWANEEQQEEVEYILLAAEKLQLAMYHVKEATFDILFRELEMDEGKTFEELVEKKAADGVLEMIESLYEKVMNVVGSVEVPDSEGDDEVDSDESSDGDSFTTGEDNDENRGADEEKSNLDLERGRHASKHDEHKILRTLQFLDTPSLMVALLPQVELWAVLDECRKIVEQARGVNVGFSPSLLDDWPGLEKKGTCFPGGLGDGAVSALAAYRHHVSENGGSIDGKVYQNALEFINFAKERNQVASGAYPKPNWRDNDACRRYYEATVPCTPVFVKRMREYAATVLDNGWKFDERVLDALEVLIRQAKGKANLDSEGDYSSLPLGDSPTWQGQEKILVCVKGYSKLCEDEGADIDLDVLGLAQEIVDRTKRYEKHHSECECECCGRQMEAKTCRGNCGDECVCVVACIVVELEDEIANRGMEDEDDTIVFQGAGSRTLSPIDEDPEAEAASESESDVVVGEGHFLVLTEDGKCEDFKFEVEAVN
ncbi:hypothetical protein N431DRAFT_553203 [Stipitochalara longipes BDJ]|nr:hypothetical protein N431DRAFT_553203 [Stipitochalara longipes BDJ]